jgi:hypothetical protein
MLAMTRNVRVHNPNGRCEVAALLSLEAKQVGFAEAVNLDLV